MRKSKYKILGKHPSGGHWLFPKDKLTFTQANRYLKRIPETKGFSYKVVKI